MTATQKSDAMPAALILPGVADWHGQAETIIGRLAARWGTATSGRLAMDTEDVAQELWLAALAAEGRRPGTWRVAIRRRYAHLTRSEVRRRCAERRAPCVAT